MFLSDASLSDDNAAIQHDGDPPVVEAEKFFVGVDVGEAGFVAKLAEEGQGLVTEMAALAGDQDQLHGAEPSAAG